MWTVNSLTSVERCADCYHLECSLPEVVIFLWACGWSETWPGPLACWYVLWHTLKWQSSEVWSELVFIFLLFLQISHFQRKGSQNSKGSDKMFDPWQ